MVFVAGVTVALVKFPSGTSGVSCIQKYIHSLDPFIFTPSLDVYDHVVSFDRVNTPIPVHNLSRFINKLTSKLKIKMFVQTFIHTLLCIRKPALILVKALFL